MSIEWLTVIMFVTLLITIYLGSPLSITLGGVAMIFTLIIWGPKGLYMAATTSIGSAMNDTLLSIPLFIFMGTMLQNSGIAEDMYDLMYRTIGRVKGGLAVGTVAICTVFAAMAGISAVATITMGLIALPSMLKRGYDKQLALGCIAAGGALGILIPPSVPMILYALLARESVGKLFAGGFLPGFLLSGFFMAYILILCALKPNVAPAVPLEARKSAGSMMRSFRAVFWPIILIVLVLGSIYSGACTPTEAAGAGALGSVIAVILNGRFTIKTFVSATTATFQVTVMVMWIVIGSCCFSNIFNAAGSQDLVANLLVNLPGGRWGVFIFFQFIYFILGMLLDPTGIVMICTPIFVPVITKLGFDPVWFGVTFIVNMEMAYLTPPFGYNLFYLRSIAPPGVEMTDIYKSVVPFIALQMLCLVVVSIFPEIILWLPRKLL